MINLYEKGAYLVNGTELVDEDNTEKLAQLTGSALSKEEARQNTIAYGILSDHNTSGNMDKLMIKFDTLTSHDITFVGIISATAACMCLLIRLSSTSLPGRCWPEAGK